MKESGEERLKYIVYESTRTPLRVDFYKGRYPKAACKSLMHTDHADGSDDERHPEKLKGSEVLPEDGKGEKNG